MKKHIQSNFNPFYHKAVPTEEDCKRIQAELNYYRPILFKVIGENFLKLIKEMYKANAYQEGGKNQGGKQ